MSAQSIRSLLLDGAVAGQRLVVVGENGEILVSADGGNLWKEASTPTRALLTAVHMHDERNGWAVGHDAVILRTRDGGENWETVHEAPDEERPLLDVWFRDEHSGFAIGAYGYFLATEDGGNTWSLRLISQDDFHLNAVAPAGETRLFIAAEAGRIYRSDNGGTTWRELPSPYNGSWFHALALSEDRLLLMGLRGNLHWSGDAGENWNKLPTATRAALTSGALLTSGDILITGLEGMLLTIQDELRGVSLSRLPSRLGISAAVPLPNGEALLLGEFGMQRWSGEQ